MQKSVQAERNLLKNECDKPATEVDLGIYKACEKFQEVVLTVSKGAGWYREGFQEGKLVNQRCRKEQRC